MELIKPNVEIWEQDTSSPVEGMYAHIARCTRVCYQSEKKDDKETEEDFVNRVILRNYPWNSEANHLAMLEHGTVYLLIPHILDDISKYEGRFRRRIALARYVEQHDPRYRRTVEERNDHGLPRHRPDRRLTPYRTPLRYHDAASFPGCRP